MATKYDISGIPDYPEKPMVEEPIEPTTPSAQMNLTPDLLDYFEGKSTQAKPQPEGPSLGRALKVFGAEMGNQLIVQLPKAMDRLAQWIGTHVTEPVFGEAGAAGGGYGKLANALKEVVTPEDVKNLTEDQIDIKIARTIAGIGGGLIKIGTLTMLGIPPPIAMGVVGGVDTYAEGGTPAQVGLGAGIGAAMGTAFEGVAPTISALTRGAVTPFAKAAAKAPLTRAQQFIQAGIQPMGKMGRIPAAAGIGAGAELVGAAAQGRAPTAEELLTGAGIMGVFGAMGGPGRTGMQRALERRGFDKPLLDKLSYQSIKTIWSKKIQPAPTPEKPYAETRTGAMEALAPEEMEAWRQAQGGAPGVPAYGEPEAWSAMAGRGLKRPYAETRTGVTEPWPAEMQEAVRAPVPFGAGGEISQAEWAALGGGKVVPKEISENLRRRSSISTLADQGFDRDVLEQLPIERLETLIQIKTDPKKYLFDLATGDLKEKGKKGIRKKPLVDRTVKELEEDLSTTVDADVREQIRAELLTKSRQAGPTQKIAEPEVVPEPEIPVQPAVTIPTQPEAVEHAKLSNEIKALKDTVKKPKPGSAAYKRIAAIENRMAEIEETWAEKLPGEEKVTEEVVTTKKPKVAKPTLYADIVEKILSLTQYGMRQEVASVNSRKAIFSNNAGRWVTGGELIKKGQSVRLDANQMLVPSKYGVKALNDWFATEDAPTLPLYAGSFERTKEGRRARGEQATINAFYAAQAKEGKPTKLALPETISKKAGRPGIGEEPTEGTPEHEIWIRKSAIEDLKTRLVGKGKRKERVDKVIDEAAKGINFNDATLEKIEIGKLPKEFFDEAGKKRGLPTKEELLWIRSIPKDLTAADYRDFSRDIKRMRDEIAGFESGKLKPEIEEIPEKVAAPRERVEPRREKTMAEIAAEAGLSDDEAVRFLLEERMTEPEPMPTEIFVPKAAPLAAEISGKLKKRTTKSEAKGAVRELSDAVRKKQEELDHLKFNQQTLTDSLLAPIEEALEKGEAKVWRSRTEMQVKELQTQIDKLQTEVNKDLGIMDVAKKTIAGKGDEQGLSVGDAKVLRNNAFGDAQGKVVVYKTSNNVQDFTILTGTDPRLVESDTNPPVIKGEAKIVIDKKGDPHLKYMNVDTSLDPRFGDQMLDTIKTHFMSGKDPRTLIVDPDAGGNITTFVNRKAQASGPSVILRSQRGAVEPPRPEEVREAVNTIGKRMEKIVKGIYVPMREKLGLVMKGKTLQAEADYLSRVQSIHGDVDPSLFKKELVADLGVRDYLSILDYLGDPANSMDAKIRTVGTLNGKREYAKLQLLQQARTYRDKYFGWMADDPAKQGEFVKYLHGMEKSSDPRILESATAYRKLMDDFRRVGDLDAKGIALPNYATLQYDFNKLYDFFKKPIEKSNRYEDLPDKIATFMQPEDFELVKSIVDNKKRATWDKLTDNEKDVVQLKLFNWVGAYHKWMYAPLEVQMRMPEKKWNAYYQQRTAGDALKFAVKENFFEIYDNYVRSTIDAITAEQFLKDARPVINSMPGATSWMSKRSYLEKYIRSSLFGRQSISDKAYNTIARKFNESIAGVDIAPLYLPSKIAGKFQQWAYRGLLGPDTAIRNLLQNMNTIAETGNLKVLSALKARLSNSKEWGDFQKTFSLFNEFAYHTGLAEKGAPKGPIMSKLGAIDQKITELALSPLRISENINKALQYFSGLEDSAKLGLDFHQANLVGIKKAFSVLENPAMTEAQWNAWNKVWKTQFGYTPAHQSPYMRSPLGRVSSLFWSYPAKTLQLWRTGILESAISGDTGRLARYLALTGFSLTAPLILGKTLGLDVGTLYGPKGILPNDFWPIWLKIARDAWTAAGGTGVAAWDKDKASEEMTQLMSTVFIPQYRYGKKIATAWKNIERGYRVYGKTDQPLVETNDYQEVLALAGFPPSDPRYARDFYRYLKDEEYKAQYDRQKAIKDVVESMNDGAIAKAYEKIYKYRAEGLEMTLSDVANEKRKQETDIFEQFKKKGKKSVREAKMLEIIEAQRQFFPSKYGEEKKTTTPYQKGTRPMWSSTPEEEEEI